MKIKSLNIQGLTVRDSNLRPLWYQCITLPTGSWSPPKAGRNVSAYSSSNIPFSAVSFSIWTILTRHFNLKGHRKPCPWASFVSTSSMYYFLLDSLIQKEVERFPLSLLGERTGRTYKQEGYENDDYLHKAWKRDFYDSINDYIITLI